MALFVVCGIVSKWPPSLIRSNFLSLVHPHHEAQAATPLVTLLSHQYAITMTYRRMLGAGNRYENTL